MSPQAETENDLSDATFHVPDTHTVENAGGLEGSFEADD